MVAYFDASDGNPKVVLKISSGRKEKEIKALMDTGHTGSLSLPVWDLIDMGAKLSTVGEVEFCACSFREVPLLNIKLRS